MDVQNFVGVGWLADDRFNPVIDSSQALKVAYALVELRQGYKTLVQRMIAPFPLEFKHDQTKRNQMTTLLSRSDTLWVLVLIYSESEFADKRSARRARARREEQFGEHLTRATLARSLAVVESGDLNAISERRHTVAASRIVEAGLAYGLFENDEMPDEKQQPICGSKKLAEFVHALGDHAYWTMHEALDGEADAALPKSKKSLKETRPEFKRHKGRSRLKRQGRISAEDFLLSLLLPGD